MWTPYFRTMRSHSMTKLAFYLFIYLFGEKNMIFRKDLELPLIFVLFLKGKKNPKCDSLFGKDGL